MKIIIASKNDGKIREIVEILGLKPSQVLTYKDFSDWPDIEETGATFEENARIKAQALTECHDMAALADDSGLQVDHLGGKPGVLSARYAGVQGDDNANVAKLLKEMEGVPEDGRSARFVCLAVLTLPGGKNYSTCGDCKGAIATEPRGLKGFGYDPVFVPDGYNKTMAELEPEFKNELSHRGKAFRQMKEIIEVLRD
ncbi:MAG: XTP/dITP diphosphatase [Actinomycetota bacterium]|nr:XTP/dITP diphosphatase [Actinomycetota bacterium]